MIRCHDNMDLDVTEISSELSENEDQQEEASLEKRSEMPSSGPDKLLVRLEEHEPEQAQTQDEECAICICAKATMQTFPCGHRVVCRKCFVKTIQMAVSQRLLPLRCVICRAKILRLKQLSPSNKNKSQQQQEHGGNEGHHGFPQSPLANPLPDGQLLQRHIRKPPYLVHSSILYPMSSHRRAASLRQRMAFKPPNLLSIPESEELDLMNAVQDREVLCPDFGNIENKWSEKEILKTQLNAKDQLGKADHYQVVKWLSKFRQFKPPSILKGIRNRWKK
ncbi:hypothetical protein AVEN_184928-1 [Araneus ventricosus]|uniref:RING-type domain-containing protein n=1 Tax=Araneus ventricosus TaxID=182803 RepID=A0A4Y2QCQ7_ARAVE|nr:hypothetical protein AVEN_225535-1 [Araneus ventricosus]GBN60407.1 hypothetical protein AVEN_184928-1 [Araneus ventricosus]